MSSDSSPGRAVQAAVLRALRRVCESEGFDPAALISSASLVHDMRMDSLVFVEVTVALEEELGVAAFPLQSWADEEALRAEGAYTLGSLVAFAERFAPRSAS
ncbi:MAG TPA: phosphopantetheine-binding protein [Polyangiales bacterium]|nr:phosphopantetheine-binding protein [Polyangiales bacterium]